MSRYTLEKEKINEVTLLASPKMIRERSIFICFTTRIKGVSSTPFDTLNLAFHVGDKTENVVENRRKVAAAVGFSPELLTTGQQVHGDRLVNVVEKTKGSGALDHQSAIFECDGLVTGDTETPLAVLTADCVPVILVDPDTRAVGVVHAGWKGLYKDIVSKAIDKMENDFPIDRKRLVAFIGPAIGPCCYEVGQSHIDDFVRVFGRSVSPDGRNLDLPAVAVCQLRSSGLKEESMIIAGLCTSCRNDLFFSFRRDEICGRQAAIVSVNPM